MSKQKTTLTSSTHDKAGVYLKGIKQGEFSITGLIRYLDIGD